MSFWRFGFQQAAVTDTVMENATLDDLLEQDSLLQSCKDFSEKHLELICRPAMRQRLLHLLVNPASESPADLRKSYICCELLALDLPALLDALITDKEELVALWSFLDRPAPLNPLLASYFSKANCMLLQKHLGEMLATIKSIPGVIDKLLMHIGCSAIADLTLKLITCEDMPEGRGVVDWLSQENFIPQLVDHLDPHRDPEEHNMAAQSLLDIIAVSYQSAQGAVPDGNGDAIGVDGPPRPAVVFSAPTNNALIATMKSRPIVTKLVTYMLVRDAPHAVSTFTNGINIIIELMRRYCSEVEQAEYQLQLEQQNALNQAQASEVDPDQTEEEHNTAYIVRAAAQRHPAFTAKIAQLSVELVDLLRVLDAHAESLVHLLVEPRQSQTPVPTTIGPQVPLGSERLKACELFAEVLHLQYLYTSSPLFETFVMATEHVSLDDIVRIVKQQADEGHDASADGDADDANAAGNADANANSAALAGAPDADAPAPASGQTETADPESMTDSAPASAAASTPAAPPSAAASGPTSAPASASALAAPSSSTGAPAAASTSATPTSAADAAAPTAPPSAPTDIVTTDSKGASDPKEDVSEVDTVMSMAPTTATAATSPPPNRPTSMTRELIVLTERFLAIRLLPTCVDIFFNFCWNNFMHSVVYDMVAKVFNTYTYTANLLPAEPSPGTVDEPGANPRDRGSETTHVEAFLRADPSVVELAKTHPYTALTIVQSRIVEKQLRGVQTAVAGLVLSILIDGGLVDKIMDAQRRNDAYTEQPRGVRLGYMGHLTYIADEVCKLADKCGPDMARVIHPRLHGSPVWQEYIHGVLRETREQDRQPLGGARPDPSAVHVAGHGDFSENANLGLMGGDVLGRLGGDSDFSQHLAFTGNGDFSMALSAPPVTTAFGPTDGSVEGDQMARFVTHEVVAGLSDRLIEQDVDDGRGAMSSMNGVHDHDIPQDHPANAALMATHAGGPSPSSSSPSSSSPSPSGAPAAQDQDQARFAPISGAAATASSPSDHGPAAATAAVDALNGDMVDFDISEAITDSAAEHTNHTFQRETEDVVPVDEPMPQDDEPAIVGGADVSMQQDPSAHAAHGEAASAPSDAVGSPAAGGAPAGAGVVDDDLSAAAAAAAAAVLSLRRRGSAAESPAGPVPPHAAKTSPGGLRPVMGGDAVSVPALEPEVSGAPGSLPEAAPAAPSSTLPEATAPSSAEATESAPAAAATDGDAPSADGPAPPST